MSTPTNGRHVNLANTPFLWKGFFRATPMLTTGQRKAPYLRVLPLFHNRRLALLPFALFSGAARSGASWCPQFQNGRCHLGIELRPPFQKDPVPPHARSHPNSAICYQTIVVTLLLLSLRRAQPCCFATAR